MRKLKILMIGLLVIAMLLHGCGTDNKTDVERPAAQDNKTGASTEPAVKQDLIVAHGADAKSLDPHATNDQPSSRIMKQMYETLVVQDENMDIQPGLAETWEQLDDTTFQFNLRKGVKFHNGEPFKASDVKFTLLRAIDSPNVGHIVGAIDPEKIEIVDDHTIKIGTKMPFAPLLAHLAHTGSSILNEKAVTDSGENYGQNPVGTGPFKYESWANGDNVVVVVNEEYYGEKPAIGKITFRAIPENTSRTIELETGGVHIIYDVDPNDVNRVNDNDELVLIRDKNLSTTYIGFNCEKKPFDDVRVRKAINMALDTKTIVDHVYRGTGYQAKGPLGPNVWGSNQNLKPYEFDVEAAKKLLAEAGFPDGFKTTVWTNENQQRMDIAEIMQNQLGKIGIEVETKVMEWGAYLDGTAAGEHDMFILGWVTVTGDADYGLYALFHSDMFGDAGNRTFYGNKKVDELLELGRTSTDLKKREAAYHEVQEIINDEAPWVFTWGGESLSATSKKVKGFKQHPAGHHVLKGVTLEK